MMNTSLLSNPKPSLGQNKPFGPRADKGPRRGQSGGAPSFQEFLNPTLHNSHGRTSNPTVSYPFMTRPFKSGGGRPLEGEILFSLRQEAKKAGAGFLITTVPLSFLNAKLFEQSSRVAGHRRQVHLHLPLKPSTRESTQLEVTLISLVCSAMRQLPRPGIRN